MLLYGLPEGHWPMEKTGNRVFSMLHHEIEEEMKPNHVQGIKKLMLHADNCAG